MHVFLSDRIYAGLAWTGKPRSIPAIKIVLQSFLMLPVCVLPIIWVEGGGSDVEMFLPAASFVSPFACRLLPYTVNPRLGCLGLQQASSEACRQMVFGIRGACRSPDKQIVLNWLQCVDVQLWILSEMFRPQRCRHRSGGLHKSYIGVVIDFPGASFATDWKNFLNGGNCIWNVRVIKCAERGISAQNVQEKKKTLFDAFYNGVTKGFQKHPYSCYFTASVSKPSTPFLH